jgi:hypothetical protein
MVIRTVRRVRRGNLKRVICKQEKRRSVRVEKGDHDPIKPARKYIASLIYMKDFGISNDIGVENVFSIGEETFVLVGNCLIRDFERL